MEDNKNSCPSCAQANQGSCACQNGSCVGKIIWLAVIAFIVFVIYMIGKSEDSQKIAKNNPNEEVSVLVLCTGNTCRSQMAEGFLKSFNPNLKVQSAGVKPEKNVNPDAVKAMQKEGIDISKNTPKDVKDFVNQNWDFVITVCDNANQTCPTFNGKVGKIVHIPFFDPSKFKGDEKQVEKKFEEVKAEIKAKLKEFYDKEIVPVQEDLNKMD